VNRGLSVSGRHFPMPAKGELARGEAVLAEAKAATAGPAVTAPTAAAPAPASPAVRRNARLFGPFDGSSS